MTPTMHAKIYAARRRKMLSASRWDADVAWPSSSRYGRIGFSAAPGFEFVMLCKVKTATRPTVAVEAGISWSRLILVAGP